jgi:hypothetical protein
MTSSYTSPSVLITEKADEYAAPVRTVIKFKTTYQLLEELGLSLAISEGSEGRVWLDSTPTDFELLNAANLNDKGNVLPGAKLLIRAVGTEDYLYFDGNEVGRENYQNGLSQFIWTLQREGNSLRTGDVFGLVNTAKSILVGGVFVPDQ